MCAAQSLGFLVFACVRIGNALLRGGNGGRQWLSTGLTDRVTVLLVTTWQAIIIAEIVLEVLVEH